MRLSRAELGILGYVLGLGVAAGISWISAILISRIVPAQNAVAADQAALAILFAKIVAVILVTAVVFGLMWLYPVIRRDAHERGQLALESKSYLHAALTDPLTGLQNRRYFDDALEEFIREFSAIDRPLGLLLMDLDHFKSVNDTYGHDNGDVVLRAVALSLRQHTRFHDVLARVGGEEFAVILPNTDAVALDRMAERVRAAIAGMPIVLGGKHITVTASFGVAVWDGEEDGKALLKRADKNLYAAKADGRNRVAGLEADEQQWLPPQTPMFGTG